MPLKRFREKPDLATARRFLKAGHYFWNAGMFFWQAGVFLEALRRHLPKTAALLASLPPFDNHRFPSRLRRTYTRCENISVDYAVMEKAANVAGVPAGDIGWNDLGSWNSVYQLLPRDGKGNVAGTELLALASDGNYVEASGKLVALLGVNDAIIVDTPDALLVAARARAQQVGELVKRLEARRRFDLL